MLATIIWDVWKQSTARRFMISLNVIYLNDVFNFCFTVAKNLPYNVEVRQGQESKDTPKRT